MILLLILMIFLRPSGLFFVYDDDEKSEVNLLICSWAFEHNMSPTTFIYQPKPDKLLTKAVLMSYVSSKNLVFFTKMFILQWNVKCNAEKRLSHILSSHGHECVFCKYVTYVTDSILLL